MRIYLSPSVQSFNIGYGNYGSEKFRMQQLADMVEEKLMDLGKFEVLRSTEDMSLGQAIADSNKNNVDLHVAIHSNADGGTAQGPSVYAFRPGGKADKASQAIYDRLLDIYYDRSKGKGVNYNENLKELKLTRSPAALIEVAFHDNPKDAEWIINNMNEIADQIVKGIVDYFGRNSEMEVQKEVFSEMKAEPNVRWYNDNMLNELEQSIERINNDKERGKTTDYTTYLDL